MADLFHAARLVQGVEPASRKLFCEALFMQAHAADKYVRRLRKVHPLWGDGSLRSAAIAQGSHRVRRIDQSDLLACLSAVVEGLNAAKGPRRHE